MIMWWRRTQKQGFDTKARKKRPISRCAVAFQPLLYARGPLLSLLCASAAVLKVRSHNIGELYQPTPVRAQQITNLVSN